MFRPVLRIEESTTRQPALIVLQDASRSVGADHADWGATMDQWMGTLALPNPGEPGASVNVYTFGADLTQRKEGRTVGI